MSECQRVPTGLAVVVTVASTAGVIHPWHMHFTACKTCCWVFFLGGGKYRSSGMSNDEVGVQ